MSLKETEDQSNYHITRAGIFMRVEIADGIIIIWTGQKHSVFRDKLGKGHQRLDML